MQPFRDLPIARKTLMLGLVPAIFALLVVILASLLSTYMTARRIQQADLAMPGMDGYEVLQTIRRTAPVDSRRASRLR